MKCKTSRRRRVGCERTACARATPTTHRNRVSHRLTCASLSRARAQMLLRGVALGERDHPPPQSPQFKSVNVANASHRVRQRALLPTTEVALPHPWVTQLGLAAALHAVPGAVVGGRRAAGHHPGASHAGGRVHQRALPQRRARGVRQPRLGHAGDGPRHGRHARRRRLHAGAYTQTVLPATKCKFNASSRLQITFDCVRSPAFGAFMEPVAEPCAALRTMRVLSSRAAWWRFARETLPPLWPFDVPRERADTPIFSADARSVCAAYTPCVLAKHTRN